MEEENKDNSQEGFISRWAKKKANKNSKTTFVEENESLKQGGAGAGLTDND